MIALYKKELGLFFSSLTGYIAISVFLLVTGLFTWVFKSDLNVLDSGYATLDTLFFIAPWVFLFLIPAITMRLIAEERQSGTIELLMTKPITIMQIILAKYFAGITIVLLSLIPSLIYFYSVYMLGNPVGIIDIGGTWGSYIGLFFLASIYVAIGVFASSLSSNQIVSFMLAIVLCFFVFSGFDYLSLLFDEHGSLLSGLGINEHYQSMSRGVLDSRDILYFISMVVFFIFCTKLVFNSKK